MLPSSKILPSLCNFYNQKCCENVSRYLTLYQKVAVFHNWWCLSELTIWLSSPCKWILNSLAPHTVRWALPLPELAYALQHGPSAAQAGLGWAGLTQIYLVSFLIWQHSLFLVIIAEFSAVLLISLPVCCFVLLFHFVKWRCQQWEFWPWKCSSCPVGSWSCLANLPLLLTLTEYFGCFDK